MEANGHSKYRSWTDLIGNRRRGDGTLTDARRAELVSEMVHNLSLERGSLFDQLLDPRHNVDEECGYPPGNEPVPVDVYRFLFDRFDIANRVVRLMPQECWAKSPHVFETDDPETVTDFERAWDGLSKQLSAGGWYKDERGGLVWDYLRRADELSGIGHFGVILLGIDDGRMIIPRNRIGCGRLAAGRRPDDDDGTAFVLDRAIGRIGFRPLDQSRNDIIGALNMFAAA